MSDSKKQLPCRSCLNRRDNSCIEQVLKKIPSQVTESGKRFVSKIKKALPKCFDSRTERPLEAR